MVKKTKIVRGRKQAPIDYRLSFSVDLQQAEELGGTRTSFAMTVPIRRGATSRLAKYKKEEVAALLRQVADLVEKGDYATLGPDFNMAIKAGAAASKKPAP